MTAASRGVFITLEGGEGVGKSTQIRLLASWLEAEGFKVRTTREPGGAAGSELIRDLLLKGEVDRWQPMTEALLMTASRAEHVERLIKPGLADGKIIISDRFFDSSVAYQGAARGLGMEKIRGLQRTALGDFEPDLTLVFDLPIKVGLSRALQREADSGHGEDRFERMGEDFHQTIIQAFHDIAKAEPERCKLIDATQSIEDIHQSVMTIVRAFLNERGIKPS